MSGKPRFRAVETLDPDREVWFISDLHLGDGTPSDPFFGKDQHLMALVNRVERHGHVLVVAGDAMDFHQAWTLTRILRAHQELLGAMSRLARQGRLFYIVGNHDYDLSFYRDLLNFRVCDELRIGTELLATHGFEYDSYIGNDLEGSHIATKVHHLIERYCNTWIRFPLGEFYTVGNRITFWLTHKIAVAAWLGQAALDVVGVRGLTDAGVARLEYWTRSQLGDPMCMFHPIMRRLEEDRWPTILCGHAHLPGVIAGPAGRRYVNTGSWTFASSHYVVWSRGEVRVRDWITGREFGDELYQPVISGAIDEKDFWQWWRENYMGRLRFREGEERHGRLRGWESYVRDHQYLAQLDALEYNPLAPPRGLPTTDDAVEEPAPLPGATHA